MATLFHLLDFDQTYSPKMHSNLLVKQVDQSSLSSFSQGTLRVTLPLMP